MTVMPSPPPPPRAVFTAGFAALPLDRFLHNLRAHDVDLLVDVRSAPYSRHAPHFNLPGVDAAARQAGLEYLYLGNMLGGRPTDPTLFDEDGHVLYDRVAGQPWFRQGIRQVLEHVEDGRRLVLVCGEDDPRRCHRRLLVGRVLREQGVGLAHILGDGGLLAEADLLDEERGQVAGPWRSALPLRAALPGRPAGRA